MVELVTGHANKAHATAEQAAGLNAGILGLDDYVLNVHDKFKITVVSANKVTIGTGELVMQGRLVSQGTPEDLIVTNGSQGQKRNDLIVCRYTKGSQSVESAELVVVRGTPTTGTPTDPALNTTSPLDGGTTYDMPLYRIPLDGITIGTPVPLFNVLKPMSDVWDSLTQPLLYAKFKWQDTKSFQPDAYGGGMQIVVDERNRRAPRGLERVQEHGEPEPRLPGVPIRGGSETVQGGVSRLPVGFASRQLGETSDLERERHHHGRRRLVQRRPVHAHASHLANPRRCHVQLAAPYGNPSAEYRGLAAPPLIARRVEAEPDSGGGHVP